MYKNKSILFSFFHLGESELDEARNLRQDREKFLKFEKDRYFEFLNDDVLQLNDALVHLVSSSKSTNLSLDSEGILKILNLKISLIIFPRQSNGVMFFEYDWVSNEENPLHTISDLTSLRYFGTQKKFNRQENLLKVQGADNQYLSWLTLAGREVGNQIGSFNYYSNKLGRIHLLNNAVFNRSEDTDLVCYNALRIVSKASGSHALHQDQFSYSDPRIYSFAMNEGLILSEKNRSAQQLLSKYSPILYQSVFIKLGFTDVSYKLLATKSDLRINPRAGLYDPNKIEGLRELRKIFLLLKFTSKIPISNYHEMEAFRAYLMKKFSSEIDFDDFSNSLEDLFEFLQDERDRESSEREGKIGWLLGVLGVTGFVSFIFDYVFVNGNVRLIDYLSGPTTWFPLLSFFAVIALLYKLNK